MKRLRKFKIIKTDIVRNSDHDILYCDGTLLCSSLLDGVSRGIQDEEQSIFLYL